MSSGGGASIQPGSANRKIAPQREDRANNGRRRLVPVGPFVTTTYVSIKATCPSSCPFRSGACYALAGMAHLNGNMLDAAAGDDPDAVIAAEVDLIDGLFVRGVPQDGPKGGGRPLRLHVAGDVTSAAAARALSGPPIGGWPAAADPCGRTRIGGRRSPGRRGDGCRCSRAWSGRPRSRRPARAATRRRSPCTPTPTVTARSRSAV